MLTIENYVLSAILSCKKIAYKLEKVSCKLNYYSNEFTANNATEKNNNQAKHTH